MKIVPLIGTHTRLLLLLFFVISAKYLVIISFRHENAVYCLIYTDKMCAKIRF